MSVKDTRACDDLSRLSLPLASVLRLSKGAFLPLPKMSAMLHPPTWSLL